jgi:hypothetical protein
VVREGVGVGGRNTQALYAHMNNKKIKIKKKKYTIKFILESQNITSEKTPKFSGSLSSQPGLRSRIIQIRILGFRGWGGEQYKKRDTRRSVTYIGLVIQSMVNAHLPRR